MASYGYIIMIIVDSCMIWFHFDCIMQLKKSYYIATNVYRRKSATTFGDLPGWYGWQINEMLCTGHVRYSELATKININLLRPSDAYMRR